MARYIAEIAFFDREFVSVLPSVMADTALDIACRVLHRTASKFDRASNNLRMLLSTHLHCPSDVLKRKYSEVTEFKVAVKLERYITWLFDLSSFWGMFAPSYYHIPNPN